MSFYLGIDLGSTTTKAVLMDENERILGRGITNTRSDYHVATAVAENEAKINVRFTLLRRHLEQSAQHVECLRKLEQHFTIEVFLHRLHRLHDFALQQAAAVGNHAGKLPQAVDDVLQQIRRRMTADAKFAARLQKSFFRDIVGTAYMSLAEEEAGKYGLDFEDLMGVYDVVILKEENTILDIDFEKTLAECPALADADPGIRSSLLQAIQSSARTPLQATNMVGTGYGRQRLPFREDQIRSEILCHGLGAHYFFPRTRTVLDIGGQDTKAIQVDENGIATNFQMNDRCAAGCGRYLGYIADELNLSLDELGPLAMQAEAAISVSSTCTVFAGAELRERLELGQRREDILAGLHRAIILRAMSLLARSGGIREEFTFTGGVARNPAAVKALKDLTEDNYGQVTLNIDPDSIYTGAVGAALYARRDLPPGGPHLEPQR